MAGSIVYGAPPRELAQIPSGAVQTSPLVMGSTALESFEPATLDEAVILAPPGTRERDYVLAQALRVLKPGGSLVVLAPKDKGGARLRKALEGFGCQVQEEGRRHHRICRVARPEAPAGLDAAIAAGAPRFSDALGLWTQPGVFSWDRVDPGTALLLQHLPPLAGRGADFGAGLGLIARRILEAPAVETLALVEVDRRAVEAAARNVGDPRAQILWADVRRLDLKDLDFVVTNPPFHDGGAEDRSLGQAFLQAAAQALRPGGVCWLVANRHLPYEEALKSAFGRASLKVEAGGYKVYEARR